MCMNIHEPDARLNMCTNIHESHEGSEHVYEYSWSNEANSCIIGDWPYCSLMANKNTYTSKPWINEVVGYFCWSGLGTTKAHEINVWHVFESWPQPMMTKMILYGITRPNVKDLSMMYRALWDRRHEGATRISQCTRRVAPSALTYIRVAPECLRSHNARYIMLKSDYDMKYLVLIHYEAEICKWSSEAGGGESCIVENLCIVL